MPILDIAERRKYQIKWLRKRRDEWFEKNGPCRQCGSWECLELDHKNPATKISHRVWSWAKLKRETELAKCQPLCEKCHDKKHEAAHGTFHRYCARGCRCQLCRKANADHMKMIRSKRN